MLKEWLNRAVSLISYILYLGIIMITFDVIVFKHWLGYGYPRHYEQENIERYPAPYVMFTGKPNVKDHNKFGFRGDSFEDSKKDDFRIAFFGGSTGYNGKPPIAEIVEEELNKILSMKTFVSNYSVVSSNHRQHLHGIIEYFTQFKPNIIIFYGGYNETLQSGIYDPRPGYPYNFFYRSETSPLIKLLLENSAFIGEIDKKFALFTNLSDLRKVEQPFSESWNSRIVEKYFETLKQASDIAKSMESQYCGNTKFLSFYQPYQVPEKFRLAHENIKQRIYALKYAFDVSSEYDTLGKGVYKDQVHVNQDAKQLMGKKIAVIITKEFQSGELADCHIKSAYTEMRLKHLNIIKIALQHYINKYKIYPKNLRNLVPEYLEMLPKDPRNTSDPDKQYLYNSRGNNYKLLTYQTEDCGFIAISKPELMDKNRKCAYGYWTKGAINW